MKENKKIKNLTSLLFIIFTLGLSSVFAQTTAFNYQGTLTDGGMPASGTYQMQFSLFDQVSAGTQIGSTITNNSVNVIAGVFSVSLDFGAVAFNGNDRYLQINVKKTAEPTFTTLSPRQLITSSPYAVRTLSASAADNVTGTVAVGNGGTGSTTATGARTNLGLGSLSTLSSVSSAEITNGTIVDADISGTAAIAGSKISGNISGNAANVTGTVAVGNGGTGSTTASGALNNLLPSQTGNSGRVLQTNGTTASWVAPSSGGGTAIITGYLTSNVPVNVTSPTYVNTVSVALEAGKTYLIEALILQARDTAVSTPSTYRWVYSGTGTTPTGASMSGAFVQGTSFNSSGSFDMEAAGQSVGAASVIGTRNYVATITTTTAGTLTLQAARSTTNTTLNWTVYGGSYITATVLQ